MRVTVNPWQAPTITVALHENDELLGYPVRRILTIDETKQLVLALTLALSEAGYPMETV